MPIPAIFINDKGPPLKFKSSTLANSFKHPSPDSLKEIQVNTPILLTLIDSGS